MHIDHLLKCFNQNTNDPKWPKVTFYPPPVATLLNDHFYMLKSYMNLLWQRDDQLYRMNLRWLLTPLSLRSPIQLFSRNTGSKSSPVIRFKKKNIWTEIILLLWIMTIPFLLNQTFRDTSWRFNAHFVLTWTKNKSKFVLKNLKRMTEIREAVRPNWTTVIKVWKDLKKKVWDLRCKSLGFHVPYLN